MSGVTMRTISANPSALSASSLCAGAQAATRQSRPTASRARTRVQARIFTDRFRRRVPHLRLRSSRVVPPGASSRCRGPLDDAIRYRECAPPEKLTRRPIIFSLVSELFEAEVCGRPDEMSVSQMSRMGMASVPEPRSTMLACSGTLGLLGYGARHRRGGSVAS